MLMVNLLGGATVSRRVCPAHAVHVGVYSVSCHTAPLCRGNQALVMGVNDCTVVGGVATLLKTQSPPR